MSDTPHAAADLLGNAGPLPSLRWKGKEYPVAYPCLNTVKRVELLVARQALDALEERREVLTAAEYADQKAALNRALAAREHAAGRPLWHATLDPVRLVTFTVWACLHEADPKCPLTPDDVTELCGDPDAEAGAVVALVMPGFTRAVGARMKAPPAAIEEGLRRAQGLLRATTPTA